MPQKETTNAKTKKTAFFDFDGCLVAPVFKTPDGNPTIGFLGDKFAQFMNMTGEDAYAASRTVEPVLKYAMRLRQESGWDVKILTGGMSDGEQLAKTKYAKLHFPNLFTDILFVPSPKSKIPYILEYAKQHGLRPDECMLVEDNYIALLLAAEHDIKAVSVSHIITGLYDVTHQTERLP